MESIGSEEAIIYPSILFKIQGRIYCVNSKCVSSILELPEHQSMPDTPPYITGIFAHRGGSVTMFDLRTALNMPTLADDFQAFTQMLDDRKQDHLTWVSTLKQCIQTHAPFPLATDPHKCALGRWYDSFQPDSQEIAHQLAQMETPHRLLHESATRASECLRLDGGQGTCLKDVVREVDQEYVPRILGILDEAKDIFRARAYHEMVLLLSGERALGLVVDEVLSVERLSEERTETGFKDWCFSPFLSRIMHSETYDELIMEINVPEILRTGDRLPAPAE